LETDLRAALGGDGYEQALARARTVDFDRAVDALIESDPAAQRSSDGAAGYLPPQD
jgi:hypothetical protein